MNVRLVAYRKAESDSTSTTGYQLDLAAEPNIGLNFQFSDIKEPETRKGNYSYTFKLPFTSNNNQFFQDWYNVNIDTLVFNTRTSFEAVLFVGSVPQFEGVLQLRAIYQQEGSYEVVMISNTSNLFNSVGQKRLRDVFLNDNGTFSTEFNHTYNETQLLNSWIGNTNDFVNIDGDSLRDTDADVQKIVYPISVTAPNFFYNSEDLTSTYPYNNKFLAMDQDNIDSMGYDTASQVRVPLAQFRPGIQIRTMLKLIFARAGFSYTSAFIDSDYFGKIFMTTCNHLEEGYAPTTSNNTAPSGQCVAGRIYSWGAKTTSSVSCGQSHTAIMPLNITTPISGLAIPIDMDGIWNTDTYYFTKMSTSMETVTVSHGVGLNSITACNYADITLTYKIKKWNQETLMVEDTLYAPVGYGAIDYTYTYFNNGNNYFWKEITLDISDMPTGAAAVIEVTVENFKRAVGGGYPDSGTIRIGETNSLQDFTGLATFLWTGISDDIYGLTVDIPGSIDPSLTQRGFLKDIIERFNLIIVTDPDNDSNLIIEPYNDYMEAGELKNWTNKLDTSKEIVVKDTSSIQKNTVHFTDLEDQDIGNKEVKELFPNLNVFGHIKIDQSTNPFAQGELTNNPMFSPYINSLVYKNAGTQAITELSNFTVQYEVSFETTDGEASNPLKKTKPKLFWYNGLPTDVINEGGSNATYYLHSNAGQSENLTAYSFTKYPVCSPFEVDISSSDTTYQLTQNSRSLYWNSTRSPVDYLDIFSAVNYVGISWFNAALYGKYWKPYLDTIYSENARIMECYLNLNEVDIFNFKFNNEIFIKDTYWTVLSLSNYQVGEKTSTKATLIKSLDTKVNCPNCNKVVAFEVNGYVTNNTGGTEGGGLFVWCPDTDPNCSITLDLEWWDTSAIQYLLATPECCECNGGYPDITHTQIAEYPGQFPCYQGANSQPLAVTLLKNIRSVGGRGGLKSMMNGKLAGANKNFAIGSNYTKFGQQLLPYNADDMSINYVTKNPHTPQLQGESHKLILVGYTDGNTRSYAYPQGSDVATRLNIPNNANIVLRVKGISTVIGGKSATYPVGTTDAFSYYTAFIIANGTKTQLGTAGGDVDFHLRQAANPITCTLNIDVATAGDSPFALMFGLDDTQTDTKRLWELSVELDMNAIFNISEPYDENWALFQNGQRIQFENSDYLIWN
jgi:hypothetical protein